MRKIADYEYKVQPLDVDFNGSIRTTQLIGYLLHTAGENAEENGFGIQPLQNNGQAWVASRLAMEVYSYPKTEDTFRIETWIEDFSRMFTTRNFKIIGSDNSVIGAGSSIWCLLDMETRKSVDLNFTNYGSFATGIPSIIDKPGKVPTVAGEPVSRHRVKYSDMDYNRHANSMKYVEWMIDLFPLELFEKREIRRIDINYVNELHYGEKVDIYCKQHQDDGCLFEMRSGEDVICKAAMKFDGVFDLA